MTNKENDEFQVVKTKYEIYKDQIESYSQFIKFSFRDLVALAKDNKLVFLDLYYNRETELNEMRSILKNIRNRGDNILILGDAGSGKSNFIYKVFYEIENLPNYKLYPIIVDYRDALDKEYLLKSFINQLKKYFEDSNCPLNSLLQNTDDNIKQNLHLLKAHLTNVSINDLNNHLIILLDDFDYLEATSLFEILDLFLGFGIHKCATLVLSARPPLRATINEYDNRFAKNFTRDVHTIELTRLDVKKLISRRLAIILEENSIKFGLTKWWKRIISKTDPYCLFLEKMNIVDLNNLEKIDIPFSGLYLNFIRCVTNHNIREIFEIIHHSLIYVLKNYESLNTIIETEDGEEVARKDIPIEIAMQMFFDSTDDKSFKIINLNSHRTTKGNSILFNVLESVKLFGEISNQFYELLKKVGIDKNTSNLAINTLESAEYAMIVPRRLAYSLSSTKLNKYPEYKLTKKGEFYLSVISYWDEYISRCGNFGESIDKYYN
ncbi:MAG: ATP-binding protein [Saprospiraceae bacterium]|nr:ATP-binding protein [Saprospiraceae bacterium]